jgi:Right handed beta helix region
MKSTIAFVAVGLALAATLSASPAMALRDRTFVSPTGNDGNDCSQATPCRTFQGALAQTNAGGEISVLGTAGYGTVVIDKAVSIVNPGGFEASMFVPSNGAGITIDAGVNDAVTLRGLTINSSSGATGNNGIVFNSGKSLTVDNCVVQNLNRTIVNTGVGIFIRPTSGTMNFTITNTTVSNNRYVGIYYFPPSGSPTANGIIDKVVANGNFQGIVIDSETPSGGTTTAAISNTTASYNTGYGIRVFGGSGGAPLSVSIDNATLAGNTDGIFAESTASVLLGRSTIVSNSEAGIHNNTNPNTFYSFGNNQMSLNGNGNAVTGNALTPIAFQ